MAEVQGTRSSSGATDERTRVPGAKVWDGRHGEWEQQQQQKGEAAAEEEMECGPEE